MRYRRWPGSGWLGTLGRVGWLSLALCGLVGCLPAGELPLGPPPARSDLPSVPGKGLPRYRSLAQRGALAYTALCASCHGAGGGGDGPAAAALQPRPTNFLDANYRADQRPTWYFQAISEGVIGGAMSRWDHQLDEATRWDLAYYVWSLALPPASLSAGAQAYAEHCASCHGEDGSAVAAARLDDPRWAALSPRELRRRLAVRHPELLPVAESPQTIAVADWLATFLYEPVADDGTP